jgi:flavin-dependent dehydrogenase
MGLTIKGKIIVLLFGEVILMSVVIIGAGLSGLSCAITLEQNGINPIILEKRSCIGDRFINAEALFSILERPFKNSIKQLDKKYNIILNPISEVTRLIIHSKNQTGSIDGNIGYTNIRGRHKDSFENQLSMQIKSQIKYNSDYAFEDIAKKFEHVVLATGDGAYAYELNNYRCDLTIS